MGTETASRAHRLLHDKVGYSTVCFLSHSQMFKLTKHSFLNSIGSDLDLNSDNVFFFFFKGERIQISLKAGHHRPASETPFNEGIRSSIAKGSEPPVPPLDPPMGPDNVHLLIYTENPFYRAHRLLYDTLHSFYRMHKFLN